MRLPEEQAFSAALQGDDALVKELLGDLTVEELQDLADTTEILHQDAKDLMRKKRRQEKRS